MGHSIYQNQNTNKTTGEFFFKKSLKKEVK